MPAPYPSECLRIPPSAAWLHGDGRGFRGPAVMLTGNAEKPNDGMGTTSGLRAARWASRLTFPAAASL